jgi:2-phospho-L-lactate guanylyltransferase
VPKLDVLVPMKPLASAKSRLASVMPDLRRQAVALLMLRRVLDAVSRSVGIETCLVVGGDDTVQSVVRDAGCRWVPEPGHDLNSSLWLAMHECFEAGADATLFLPADLPQASPIDVAEVVSSSRGLTVAVGVSAHNDGGTNALLVPAPFSFPPALGEDSYARHIAGLRTRGSALFDADAPGLAFDVDTPTDLAWAEVNVEGFTGELDERERWLGKHRVRPYTMAGGPSAGGRDRG